MSALARITDSHRTSRHFRNVPILLQKSFWGDERKFLEPLMRFTSGDVRDHIVSSKIDHGPPLVALKRDAAAEKSKDKLSRDF